MYSPVDNLRRYATPVVTAGAAGSPPVARFNDGGDVAREEEQRRIDQEIAERIREIGQGVQGAPRQGGMPALPRPQGAEGSPQIGKPPAEGDLMARLRESLGQSAVPSPGESFRQQLMALGAGMAGSQSRSFAGAMAEGVNAVRQQEQQQQQAQRQLLETEGNARYREATIELQRAEQAWNRDPNNPRTIRDLAQAQYYMSQAAARAAGGGRQERLGTGIPGEGGVYFPAVGRFVQYPEGFRPYAQLAGEEVRADRRAVAQQREDAAISAAESRWIQAYGAAEQRAIRRLTPVQALNPDRYIGPMMENFVRRFPPPTPSLRGAFADVLEPAAPAANSGNVPRIRMVD